MIERIVAYIMAVINLIMGFFGIDKPVEKTKVENFRVTSYVIADRIQDEASICTEDFDIITDVSDRVIPAVQPIGMSRWKDWVKNTTKRL